MDSLNPEYPPLTVTSSRREPRIWKFWSTALWGLLIFVAMVIGQISVVVFFAIRFGIPIVDFPKTIEIAGIGLTTALTVIMGLPGVLAVAWLAARVARVPFADYLALRRASWKNFLLAAFGLVVLAVGWDLMSRATGRQIVPGIDVLKAAREEGVVWLLVPALCIAAPIWEEIFARGVLYRGWSETFLRVPGAIVLSSLVWTLPHLQYDLYYLAEVFCIGLWFGYMRYRSGSTLLTIVIHGLNNLAVLVQGYYLANQ